LCLIFFFFYHLGVLLATCSRGNDIIMIEKMCRIDTVQYAATCAP